MCFHQWIMKYFQKEDEQTTTKFDTYNSPKYIRKRPIKLTLPKKYIKVPNNFFDDIPIIINEPEF